MSDAQRKTRRWGGVKLRIQSIESRSTGSGRVKSGARKEQSTPSPPVRSASRWRFPPNRCTMPALWRAVASDEHCSRDRRGGQTMSSTADQDEPKKT